MEAPIYYYYREVGIGGVVEIIIGREERGRREKGELVVEALRVGCYGLIAVYC
jgi:hypothetical protein